MCTDIQFVALLHPIALLLTKPELKLQIHRIVCKLSLLYSNVAKRSILCSRCSDVVKEQRKAYTDLECGQ